MSAGTTWGPRRWRAGMLAPALLLALAACKGPPEAPADAAAVAAPAGAAAGSAAPARETAATTSVFKAADLPVSSAALGDFPYLGLPEGYARQDVVESAFDRVPFWTGDHVEWVEGRVHSASLHSGSDRPYSQLELNRNVRDMVESLGGKRIFSGVIPAAMASDIGNGKAAVTYVGGLGDIYNEPAETYVIHRADRDIWVHLGGGGNAGGMLIAETRPVQITAKVLPADALKQALDTHGKVAIQVNFATDAAQILPDSEPQIQPVIALLKADPALRLAVEGHTDNRGGEAHNQALSNARAEAVRSRLLEAGTDANRLTAAGFGQGRPVADNGTEAGRSANRRVELIKR